MRSSASLALLAVAMVLPGAASATLFRCGSTYQDRPCADSGGREEVIRPSGARAPSTGVVPRDPASPAAPAAGATPAGQGEATAHARRVCAQRGEDAERLAWKKEGGMTRDKQLEELRGSQRYLSDEKQELVAVVYARGGTAMEIRKAVEADCLKFAPRKATEKAEPHVCKMLADQKQQVDTLYAATTEPQRKDALRRSQREIADSLDDAGCR